MSDLLTVPEAAEKLRKSPAFVADEIRRKNLRAAKFGRQWHVSRADLDAYIEAHMSIPALRRSP